MPKFRQIVSGSLVICVEAEDMYEADNIISKMSNDELMQKAEDIEWYSYDTPEFPEEV